MVLGTGGLMLSDSYCIDKNQQECHYRQKPPTKLQSKTLAAFLPMICSSVQRPVGLVPITADLGTAVALCGWSDSRRAGTTSFKRYALALT